jgi:hypothetical protein
MEKRLKGIRNFALACERGFNIWKPERIDFLGIPVCKPDRKKESGFVIKAEFPRISVVLSYDYERPALGELQKLLHTHFSAIYAPAACKSGQQFAKRPGLCRRFARRSY